MQQSQSPDKPGKLFALCGIVQSRFADPQFLQHSTGPVTTNQSDSDDLNNAETSQCQSQSRKDSGDSVRSRRRKFVGNLACCNRMEFSCLTGTEQANRVPKR